MNLSSQQAAVLRIVIDATVDAIKACGDLGAPAGVVYAALQTQGCTLSQFESLIGALVKSGQIRRDGDLLFIASKRSVGAR